MPPLGRGLILERGEVCIKEKPSGKRPEENPHYRLFFHLFSLDPFLCSFLFFLPGRVFGRDVLPCTTFQRHLQHLFSLCTYRVFIWPTHPNFQRAKPKLCVLRVSLSGCVSPPNSPSLHNCAVLLSWLFCWSYLRLSFVLLDSNLQPVPVSQ